MLFDKNISPVSFLGILVVDKRIVESVDMPGCFPDGGMHENCRIDAHYVVMQKHHAVPPVFLNVVLQFNTVLAIVVYCA